MFGINKQACVGADAIRPYRLEKNYIQTIKTDSTDHEIDCLVYELYGLTADEIRLWKGNRQRVRADLGTKHAGNMEALP